VGESPHAFSVRVVTLDSEPVSRDVILYGRTEPARAVTLRAELEGRVVELGPERGSRVSRGELIARLDTRDLAARLQEAEAVARQRELQFEAAQRLEQQQFQSQTALAEARANLAAARARVEQVQVSLQNTRVRAPFNGILETRHVEVGDFLSEGNQVARIIDVHPMLVAGYITQRELSFVHTGAPGTARLVTGETVAGIVRYLSAESDTATRTFRVELEVPNPETRLVAGVTAEIRITTPPTRAHLISPALLALDARERIGVKTVDDDDRVSFHPVEIVTSDSRGVWVTGLPPRARVITVGQGFVRPGDPVNPVQDADGDATTLGALEASRHPRVGG
jgi:multidrug efflux system membrane fusion protein